MSLKINNQQSIQNVTRVLCNGRIVDDINININNTSQVVTIDTDNTFIYKKDFYNDIKNSDSQYIQLRVIQIIKNDNGLISSNKLYLFTKNSYEEELGYAGEISVDKDFNIETVQFLINEISTGIDQDTPYIGINSSNLFPDDFNNIVQLIESNYIIDESNTENDKIITNSNFLNLKINNNNYVASINENFYRILNGVKTSINNIVIPLTVINRDTDTSLSLFLKEGITNEILNSNESLKQSYFIYDGSYYLFYRYNNKLYLLPKHSGSLNNSIEIINNRCVINGLSFNYNPAENSFNSYSYHLCLTDTFNQNSFEKWSVLYFPYYNNNIIEIFCFSMLKEINGKPNKDNRLIQYNFLDTSNGEFNYYNYSQENSCLASRAYNSNYPTITLGSNFDYEFSLDKDYKSYPYFNSQYDTLLQYNDFEYSIDGEEWFSCGKKKTLGNLGLSTTLPAGVIPVQSTLKGLRNLKNIEWDNNYNYYLINDTNDENIFNNNGDFIIYSINNLTFKVIDNIIFIEGNDEIKLQFLLIRTKHNILNNNYGFISNGFQIKQINNKIVQTIYKKYKNNYLNSKCYITPIYKHYYLNKNGYINQFNKTYNNINIEYPKYILDSNKQFTSTIKKGNEIFKDNSCGYLSIGAYIRGYLPNEKNFWDNLDNNIDTTEYNMVYLDNVMYEIKNNSLIEINNNSNIYLFEITDENTIKVKINDKIYSISVTDGVYTFTENENIYISESVIGISDITILQNKIIDNKNYLSYPNTINSKKCSVFDLQTYKNYDIKDDSEYIKRISLNNNNTNYLYIYPYSFSGIQNNNIISYNKIKKILVNNKTNISIVNNTISITDKFTNPNKIWIGNRAFAYSEIEDINELTRYDIIASAAIFYGSRLKSLNNSVKIKNAQDKLITYGEILENTPFLEEIDGQQFLIQ